jgi:hypothetical protein
VLQSLEQHAAEEPEVEGLCIIPQAWGTPAGKLLSQGEYVCDLDALKHLVRGSLLLPAAQFPMLLFLPVVRSC